MTVKEILSECLVKMGKDDFIAREQSEEEQKLKAELLAALNIAYRKLICDYMPLIEEEETEFTEGKCFVKNLSEKILYPIKVVVNGQKTAFKTYHDRIECDCSGRARVTYAYIPANKLGEEDEVNDMRLTSGMLSDGALGQYYFANKTFDLAESFNFDFLRAATVAKYKGRELILKDRRWTL